MVSKLSNRVKIYWISVGLTMRYKRNCYTDYKWLFRKTGEGVYISLERNIL